MYSVTFNHGLDYLSVRIVTSDLKVMNSIFSLEHISSENNSKLELLVLWMVTVSCRLNLLYIIVIEDVTCRMRYLGAVLK